VRAKGNPRKIEDILCFKTRLKILKVLMGSQSTASEIAKTLSVNYASVAKHPEILEDEGIVSHTKFGKRTRYYRYAKIPRARAVQRLMKAFQKSQQE
jgi:predicted transcriptional regulator